MKTISLNNSITAQEVYRILRDNLNPMFSQRKHEDIGFDILQNGNSVDILKPGLYEGYLFRLIVKPQALEVHESEHYVDDVNALTINAILDEIFVKYLGATAPQL